MEGIALRMTALTLRNVLDGSTKTTRSRKCVLLTFLHGSATELTDTGKTEPRETELL